MVYKWFCSQCHRLGRRNWWFPVDSPWKDCPIGCMFGLKEYWNTVQVMFDFSYNAWISDRLVDLFFCFIFSQEPVKLSVVAFLQCMGVNFESNDRFPCHLINTFFRLGFATHWGFTLFRSCHNWGSTHRDCYLDLYTTCCAFHRLVVLDRWLGCAFLRYWKIYKGSLSTPLSETNLNTVYRNKA